MVSFPKILPWRCEFRHLKSFRNPVLHEHLNMFHSIRFFYLQLLYRRKTKAHAYKETTEKEINCDCDRRNKCIRRRVGRWTVQRRNHQSEQVRVRRYCEFDLWQCDSASFFCILHFCHTCSLCRVELVVQFLARVLTQVLLCLFPGVLWLWHFLYSVGLHPVSSLHIYTFVVSRAFMAGVASQAGDADSSREPGLTSGLQGSMNVHRGALLLVPQWQCISSFVFYIKQIPDQTYAFHQMSYIILKCWYICNRKEA